VLRPGTRRRPATSWDSFTWLQSWYCCFSPDIASFPDDVHTAYIIRVEDDPTTANVDESARQDDPATPDDEFQAGTLIRLAESEQKAIDRAAWEAEGGHAGARNPFAIDLRTGATLNVHSITSTDVDATANTITIDPGLGPFELGQSVGGVLR